MITSGLYFDLPPADQVIPILEVPASLDRGTFLDGVVFTAKNSLAQSDSDYWITRWGVVTPEGTETPLREIDHGRRGVTGRAQKIDFSAPMRLPPGSIAYVQFVRRGIPGLLRGVSIIPRVSLRGLR